MSIAFIGLGSNLQQPLRQLLNALDAMAQLAATELQKCSPFYRSAAIGPGDQPDYINAVARIKTGYGPVELLAQLQAIENAQGRQREIRWGARTLDLDLLLHGEQTLQTPGLQLPHPRMTQRNFVLYPLNDICPRLRLPDNTTLQSLLAGVDSSGLERLDTAHQPRPAAALG